MPDSRTFSSRRRAAAAAVAAFAVAGFGLTACQSDEDGSPGAGAYEPSASSSPTVAPLLLVSSVKRGAHDVPVDHDVSFRATGGTLTSVKVTSGAGPLTGDLSPDGTKWTASGRL